MAHPRGTIDVEVAGVKRQMRRSLMAVANIESRLDKSIDLVIQDLADEDGRGTPKIGVAIVMFEEFCSAGGNALTAEELSSFDIEHGLEVVQAVSDCLNGGEQSDDNSPKTRASKRRGATGKK